MFNRIDFLLSLFYEFSLYRGYRDVALTTNSHLTQQPGARRYST